jgi:hypothetical protein
MPLFRTGQFGASRLGQRSAQCSAPGSSYHGRAWQADERRAEPGGLGRPAVRANLAALVAGVVIVGIVTAETWVLTQVLRQSFRKPKPRSLQRTQGGSGLRGKS